MKKECARDGYLMECGDAPSHRAGPEAQPIHVLSFKKGKAPLEDDAPQNVIVLHVNRHFSCIKGPDDDHLRPLRKCRTATFE